MVVWLFYLPVSTSHRAQISESSSENSEVSKNKEINRFGRTAAEKKRPLSLRRKPFSDVFGQLMCKTNPNFEL